MIFYPPSICKYKTLSPSNRVANALERITKYKWICGDDIKKICERFSIIACDGRRIASVIKAAMAGECKVVGMYQGEPPVYSWHEDYRAVVTALRGKKNRNDASVELLILKFKLRRS